MANNLLIVESPAKATTLKKYLGKDFEVLATYGHVRDLIPKTGAIDTENNFAMQYEVITRNSKHVDAIARAAATADHIYLAPDPDREGEAIAWHVAELLKARRGMKNKDIQRVVFYEITQTAVREAVANPRAISIPLVNAQQARRALDYLVGFNLSPLLWRKVRPGLSAGRVQSPALRLIVERELEIEAFRSQEYWSVHFDSQKNSIPFSARLFQYQGKKLEQLSIPNEAEYNKIIGNIQNAKLPPRVVRVEKKAKQRHAAAPFTTSTMQQEAARKLGMSADRTMRIAQQLYEGIDIGGQTVGLITYMRTDSVTLAKEALQEIRGYITEHFSADYLPGAPMIYKSKTKNAQEAHEAIRPTGIARTPDNVQKFLNADQARLYEMIWKRTLASQITPARFEMVSLDIRLGGDDTLFRASGQTLIFPGFISVYQESIDDAEEEASNKLPPLAEGETIPLDKLYGEQHFTQAPPRFSEASLIKALEEYGIGRPSTYASIISTLQAREYASLDKKRFKPTDVGRVVIRFLTEHFTRYVDYGFTAQMEDELDEVSDGKRDWIPVLSEFWHPFTALIQEKMHIERKDVTQALINEACPKCGKPLATRLGKRGNFIGCTAYPECDYTRNMAGDADAGEARKELGMDPVSGLPVLLLRGPFGYYVQLGEVVSEIKTKPESKAKSAGKAKTEGKAKPGIETKPEIKTKPKRISLPKEVPHENADLALALQLLQLPKELGDHPESGKKVMVNIGRFGPYIAHDGKFKSIPRSDNILNIELDRAVELLAQARTSNAVLRELGAHPEDKMPVTICEGRYGPYVKHGKVNASLPKDVTPEEITLEEGLALLAARIAKGPVQKKSTARKKPITEKTTAKKTAAKSATQLAAKKVATTRKVARTEKSSATNPPVAPKKATRKKSAATTRKAA
ncbi:MAG: type I DNA topoisomerase [Candidatus Nitrotoga sp.]